MSSARATKPAPSGLTIRGRLLGILFRRLVQRLEVTPEDHEESSLCTLFRPLVSRLALT